VSSLITIEVFDVGLFAKNTIMNELEKQVLDILTDQERAVYRAGRRIGVILGHVPGHWRIDGMPTWRTRRVDPALHETIDMMDAYNGAGSAEKGFEATTLPRYDAQPILDGFGEDDQVAATIRTELAEIEATESAAIVGISQSGYARGNRKNGRAILLELANEILKLSGSTNDVLDTGSAAATYRMRQGETGVALARALMQQYTAATLAERNRDVARWNRRILADTMRNVNTPTLLDDATDAIEGWRQP
jgi:hypothetical protein